MRVALVLLLLVAAVFAGCTQAPAPAPSASDFSDIKVQATATTGILLGVVVDEAIRPIAGASVGVAKPDGSNVTQKTDTQGRFALDALPAGTYIVRVTHPLYTPVQTSAEVVVGVAEPKPLRLQMARLFSQTAYTEQIKFDGYIACAYSYGLSSTCVNDYTRLAGAAPGCAGGCLKNYNVSKTAGNEREFRTNLGAGWQTFIMEEYWEPSLGAPASKGTLGFIISYFNRTSTGHWYAQGSGASPLRIQVDVGVVGPGQQEEPALIPAEGMRDLFVLFSSGDTDFAVNQRFQFFQTDFYYGIPPDGWSVVNGDPLPF